MTKIFYELRLQLHNRAGGCNATKKWHSIMVSDSKGELLNLCYNNPRLAVFECNSETLTIKKIYHEGAKSNEKN